MYKSGRAGQYNVSNESSYLNINKYLWTVEQQEVQYITVCAITITV